MANTTVYPFGTDGQLPSSIGIINDLTTGGADKALSAEQGKVLNTTLNDRTAPTETVSIPYDGGGRYIARDGTVTNNSGWISTQYIAVNEGDEFVYTGKPSSVSLGVAGYELVEGSYVYKKTFVDYGNSLKEDVLIIIPSGITHILAVDSKSGSASLTTTKNSTLSRISDSLGQIATTTLIDDFIANHYISNNGWIESANGAKYALFDVKAGDTISLYDYNAYGTTIAIIAKQLTPTTFESIVTKASGFYDLITYTATEDMTVAVSVYYSVRMVVARSNKIERIDALGEEIDELKGEMTSFEDKAKIPDYGTFFDKIAVIGDSLSSGTLDAVTGEDAHAAGGSFGCTWLTYLAKKWGSSIRMHYSRGGATCYSWLGSNEYGLGLMLKDSVVYDAYFIALGHNDYGNYTTGSTSDTPTNVTVDVNNDVVDIEPAANTTFMGNYKKIVNEIRTKAPNALIFCMTTYDKNSASGVGSQNANIQALAEWYYAQGDHKVFFLNYAEKTDITRSSAGYATGAHFATFGYAYVANVINQCVNDVIVANLNTNALKAWGNYLESYRTTRNDQTRSGGYLPHL